MMFKVGDEVMVVLDMGSRSQKGVVVDIIPGNEYRYTMYRVRFPENPAAVTITPNPNERWVDAPFVRRVLD